MVRLYGSNWLAGVVAAAGMVVACGTLAQIGESTDDPNAVPTTKPDPGTKPADDRPDQNIAITPTDMDFGSVPCGTQAPESKLIAITNKGASRTQYKLAIPDGSAFRIEGTLTGELAAGQNITRAVFVKPGKAGESTTDVIVSAGNAVQTIHAKTQGTGATFELLPSTLDFGDVRMQSGGGPADIEVTNKGTVAAVMAGFDQSTDFAVTFDTNPLRIEPGAKALLHATLKSAAAESVALQAVLKPVLAQTLCGTAPVLTLRGKRVNSNVTLSSGDFGTLDCDQSPTKDIVVSNYSGSMLTYTASLTATSAFNIIGAATGTVVPGTTTKPTTAVVKVQPKPFGTNLSVPAEDLTIDIVGVTGPDGGMRKVPLKVNVRGAIVTITPAQIVDFSSDGGVENDKQFQAKNSGNDTIYLRWILTRTKGGAAWNAFPPSSLKPGETRTGTVGFQPSTTGLSEANLAAVQSYNFFGEGAKSCGPLTPILLQGTNP